VNFETVIPIPPEIAVSACVQFVVVRRWPLNGQAAEKRIEPIPLM
jgi:hypothetical protein